MFMLMLLLEIASSNVCIISILAATVEDLRKLTNVKAVFPPPIKLYVVHSISQGLVVPYNVSRVL